MMDRYNRNKLLEGFGEEGQEKLRRSRVLVIGAGGLGSPVLSYLAAAGVGTIGIIDSDRIEASNLQRQILHRTADIGLLKTDSAAAKLKALNPEIEVITHTTRFTAANARALIQPYDFIIDCCDNFATKYLINDTCVAMQKPFSHGAVVALRGEVMTYTPGNASYRDIFEDAPEDGTVPTSAQIGILGSIAGIIGSIQATEAIKYIVGTGDLILNRILIFDGCTMQFFSFSKYSKEKYGD